MVIVGLVPKIGVFILLSLLEVEPRVRLRLVLLVLHVEQLLLEPRVNEEVKNALLVALNELVPNLVNDHVEFQVLGLPPIVLDQLRKVVNHLVTSFEAYLFVVAEKLAEQLNLADVRLEVGEKRSDVLAERCLVGRVVGNKQREEPKHRTEHLP